MIDAANAAVFSYKYIDSSSNEVAINRCNVFNDDVENNLISTKSFIDCIEVNNGKKESFMKLYEFLKNN